MGDKTIGGRRAVRRVISTLAEVICDGPERVAYKKRACTAQRAYCLFRQVLNDRPIEEFWVLLLDGKHRGLGLAQASVGTLTTSLVHPREVFGPAVRMGAAAIIAAHNHPSGDPEPSVEDLEVTRRLIAAGQLIGIPLLDHLVLGDGQFVSLRDRMEFSS